MKLVIVLLAFVALAYGHEFIEAIEAKDRSISSQVVEVIEGIREQMPCGFPGLGIPVLAPLRAEHRELSRSTDNFDLQAEVNQFRLDGLDNFDIVEFRIQAILSKISFKFHWHEVKFNTLYKVLMQWADSSLLSKILREGGANCGIKDMQIWGTIKYSLGVISGNVRLKEFKLYVSVGEVNSEIENLSSIKIVNRKLNQIIEEWIMLAINDNTDNIAEITNTYVVPLMNSFIGDKSLGDLLGMIGGGGGDPGGESGEKVPCVPPEF